MGKLPAFQFYPGDWLKDPELSMCSPATRGIWIDFLCRAHESGRSGQVTATPEQFARLCRCTAAEFVAAADELQNTGAGLVRKGDGVYTLTNRRMKREADEREGARERKQNQRGREKRKSRATVTQGQVLPSQAVSSNGTPASQNGHANVTLYSSSSSSTSFLPTEENVTPTPESVFADFFGSELSGRRLSIFQQEQLGVVTDISVWRQTLKDWKLNQYSPRNLAGMLESYRTNMTKPNGSVIRVGNAYVGASTVQAAPSKPVSRIKTSLPPLPKEPEYFARFKGEVEKRVGSEVYATWFRPMGFVSQGGTVTTVRVPDRVFADWIENNYSDVILEALRAAGVGEVSLVFEVATDEKEEEKGDEI